MDSIAQGSRSISVAALSLSSKSIKWYLLAVVVLSLLAIVVHPAVPMVLIGVVVLTALRGVLSFQVMQTALAACIILISPPVPPNERYFNHAILFGPIALQDLLLLASLYLWALEKASRPSIKQPRTILVKWFLAFTISFSISAIIGLLRGNVLAFWAPDIRDFLYFLLFFVWVDLCNSLADIEKALKIFLFFIFIGSVGSLVDDVFFRNFARYNSEINALMLGGIAISTSMLITSGYKTSRLCILAILITVLFGLLISYTRGCYFAMVVGVAAILVLAGGKRAVWTLLLFSGAIALLFFVAINLGLSFEKFVKSTTDRGDAIVGNLDVSSVERLLEVVEVINDFPNHPIFGSGPGGTIHVFRFATGLVINKAGFVDWWFIHNSYAQCLHKFGIFGFISFIGLWFAVPYQAAKLYRNVVTPLPKMVLLSTLGTTLSFLAYSMTSPSLTSGITNFLIAFLFATVVLVERHLLSETGKNKF
jgi:O-antigen ligase